MLHLYEQIEAAVAGIRKQWSGQPRVGIILGTGIGPLAEKIEVEASLDYESIPHFLKPTATGHRGRLVCGKLNGVSVMAMEGRFHAYEGYGQEEITLPVRVMKAMGCDLLIVTNACGGMNPNYALGDIMVIDDHINLLGSNPLIGPNDDGFGPRFPDMTEVYSKRLRAMADATGEAKALPVMHGIYAAMHGPSYETPAEVRFLRTIGADAVGMSTAPEAIAARHMGMQVLGISCITNMAAGMRKPLNHAEVMETARRVRGSFISLLEGIIERI